MKSKILAIVLLTLIAGTLVYVKSKQKLGAPAPSDVQPTNRPLPELSTPLQRITSYSPQRGDLKYRLVQKPFIASSTAAGWKTYTSREYFFTFEFPADTNLENTESLGYQLPPNQAYKGSRDNFEIRMWNGRGAYFILFMNYFNFTVPSTTVVSSEVKTVSTLKMTKQILESTEQRFADSQITVYSFEKNGRLYTWYGTFDERDFQSINEFESIVQSMAFK